MSFPTAEPPRSPAAVVAIVVSYNSARDLPACLRSLEAQRGVDPKIHVVDNASSDGSADLVRRGFPGVRLVVNDVNVGFARANNQVLERERAPFYALVNPDAVLPPDALATCVAYLEEDPAAALVGTRLVRPDGGLEPSCHAFLGLTNLLGETLGIHRALPGLRPLTSLHMPWFGHDRRARVDWIQGTFLVARGEAVRSIGGFDPAFFMYGEEMDWCRRMRDAGWSVVFLPGPAVTHVGGASSDPIAGEMFVENLRSRIRFVEKHRGRAAAVAARALTTLSVLARLGWSEAVSLGLRLSGRDPAPARRRHQARFRAAIRWVLRGLPLSEARPADQLRS
ncbi:MAG: glycosyltransferase family 2 protein [Bacteroidota bacterium]